MQGLMSVQDAIKFLDKERKEQHEYWEKHKLDDVCANRTIVWEDIDNYGASATASTCQYYPNGVGIPSMCGPHNCKHFRHVPEYVEEIEEHGRTKAAD
jgi:hypothetical protein